MTATRSGDAPINMVWALTARLPTFERPGHRGLNGSTVAALERGFAATVAQQLRGGILRHSDRQGLLRAADRLHIERFRANLIIALVQREMSRSNPATPAPVPAVEWIESQPRWRTRWRRTFMLAGVVIGIEAAVGLSVFWYCWH